MEAAAATDHARIKRLFNAVCDEADTAAQRAALLALGADEADIDRVLGLLRKDRDATRISGPVSKAAAQLVDNELKAGHRLGAWTLLSELGHGGMGRVFLAERSDGHYQQRAAIKLLLGWSGPEELIRLAHERQILASLNHPHIARLLDGGTTPRGRPYLVMEHVDGDPIDSHVATNGMDLRSRLTLFLSVCDAVAHAHRQLVIHCDIKPSNVIVNRQGRALLLDFGIAQLEGQALALGQDGAPTLSQAMTPRYASPEQQRGEMPSTAWDVFGLGRLLEDLAEPLLRNNDLRSRELRAVVACATADSPSARYVSVGDLQADLQRLLQQLPLRALPPSLAYRLHKLLRRRRAAALTLVLVSVGSIVFTLRLIHERDRAEQQAAATRAVSAFVTSLFTGADPSLSGRPDVSAAELVDQGRARLARDLLDQPQQRAALLAVLGDVYEKIGRLDSSAEVFEEVAALEGADGLARPLREADALARLALVLNNTNQPRRAEAPARRAVALLEAELPADDPRVIDAHNRLGVVLTGLGSWQEAEQVIGRVLAQRRAALGDEHLDTLSALHNLARVHHAQGRLDPAVDELRQALEIKRRVYGVRNDNALTTIEELAKVLSTQQDYAAAEALLRESLAIRSELFGAETRTVAMTTNELAAVLQDSGQVNAAIEHYQAALDCLQQTLCTSDQLQSVVLNNLGTALELVGRLAEAEAVLRRSLALRSAIYAPDDRAVARVQANLARVLLARGRVGQAAPLVEAAAQTRATRLPPDHPERLASALQRGELALRRQRFAVARQLLNEIQVDASPAVPATSAVRASAAELQAALLAAEQGLATAVPALQSAWTAKVAQYRTDRHPGVLKAGLDLLAAYRAAGHSAEAESLAEQLRASASQHGPDSPWRLQLEGGG